MRAVFLTLLSANLLFLAWSGWIDTPRAPPQDSLSHLPRLELAGEGTSTPPEAPPPSPPQSQDDKPTAGAAEKLAFHESVRQIRCTSLGPFNDLGVVGRAAGTLTQRGLHAQQRAEEGETIEGFWVFVGGLQGDDAVIDAAARLDKAGFKDAHTMKGGRISVGMFSNRDRAERRAAAVKQIGLTPEIGERKFQGTVYWIDVVTEAGPQDPPPDYSIADGSNQKISVQECPLEVQPAQPQPQSTVPVYDENGVPTRLPRTTVASAPKLIP